MFDYTGTRFDFPVVAGLAERIVLRFRLSGSGDVFDLSGATWRCTARGKVNPALVDGLYVEHGDAGELVLWAPALAADAYRYGIFATAADGSVRRVVYGVCTALTSERTGELEQAASREMVRVLNVTVPKENGAPLELQWQASSVASAAASTAQRAAQEAVQAAGAAQTTVAGLQQTVATLQGLAGQVSDMEGRLDGIDAHIRESIVPNATTNTWWVAGQDTHYPVTGEPGRSPYLSNRRTWMVWDEGIQAYQDTGLDPQGAPGKAPRIGADGCWQTWNEGREVWESTGVPARGRDGVDGTAVRRIMVEAVEDIPAECATCNGGFYYYVPEVVVRDATVIDVLSSAGYFFVVNGETQTYPAQESREAAAEAVAECLRVALAGTPGLSVTVEGTRVVLMADEPDWSFDTLDEIMYEQSEEERLVRTGGFSVYAWLEEGGDAGWVKVGLANDIATAEVFGLVKTGTDVTVTGGAPVGVNERRQLAVPRADYVTPGAVLPSVASTLGSGGGVGFTADGRMVAELSAVGKAGAVVVSFAGVCEVACIGFMPDGSLGVPWATLQQPGVMKLGSLFGQLNRIPYQQGVGATTDHQLANNLLYGGAIQHKKLAAWVQHGMEWLGGIPETPYLNETDFYMGLVTSAQFEQSEAAGLVLRSASTDRLAGVYLAAGMGDTRGNAVPSATTIAGYLSENYYTKTEVYTRTQADDRYATKRALEDAIGGVNTTIRDALLTREEFNTAKQGFVQRTGTWKGNVVLTESEYNALQDIDPDIIYFIVGDEI